MSMTRFVVFGILVLGIQQIHWHGVSAAKGCSGYKVLENGPLPCKVKHAILKEHNNLRQQIAKGLVAGQPPASNLREMFWDDELANGAQQWANQCTFQHNRNKDREVERFQVGQNIGLTRTKGTSKGTDQIDFQKHIRSWFDEHKNYKYSPITNDQTTGHYTQLVWATTFLVGCGYIRYKESENTTNRLYVCNYGPAGNVKGKKPYTVGQKLTCDKDFQKSSKYNSLCRIKNTPKDPCSEEEEKGDEVDASSNININVNDDFNDVQERQWLRDMQLINKKVLPKKQTNDQYQIKTQVPLKTSTEALREVGSQIFSEPEIDIKEHERASKESIDFHDVQEPEGAITYTSKPEISFETNNKVLNTTETGVSLESVTKELYKTEIKEPYQTETVVPYQMKIKVPHGSKSKGRDEGTGLEGLDEILEGDDVEGSSGEGCITKRMLKKVETIKDNDLTTNPYLKKIYNSITINIYH